MIATPARTAAGVRAKASALEGAIRALNGDSLLEADAELALSLSRDVAAVLS